MATRELDLRSTETTGALDGLGVAARTASRKLAALPSAIKNETLRAIADELDAHADEVLVANSADIAAAVAKGIAPSMLDRLTLNPQRIAALSRDIRSVAMLPDPVGVEIESRLLPNGMRLSRRRIPIGVLGVIYEARPNVTIDIATLCLKTGNAVILRGGSETLRTNLALVALIQRVLKSKGLPVEAVQYVENPDRALITELLRLDKYVDMIIPRGGNALHKLCREQATIPVITGGIGVCHLYVDVSAKQTESVAIIVNAKTQRPSVCNTLDTLLVNRQVAAEFLPKAAQALAEKGVTLHADPAAFALLHAAETDATIVPAEADDWDQEWLGPTLGVKIVDNLDEVIDHIQQHSQDHTDGILTENWDNAMRFVNEVNSAAVFVNASTRFNDGGQFGLGAEVAISTQKLHARGPMGLEELTTYKWIGLGNWNVRE